MPWSVGETPHEHSALWPPVGQDGKARNKLKSLKGNRGDKLMGEASKVKGMLMKWVREDEKAKAWACIHAIIISFVSICFFLAMILTWYYLYRKSFGWSVFVFVVLLVLSAAIVIFGVKRKDQRAWFIVMGFMCALVTIVGLFVGFFMYYQHLVYYWRYKEMRTYSNVGGIQPASQFNDGSMFLFTQDTRLDVMRSVGYKSRWTGQTYCVAPVVDSTMTNANAINFWAIGENCCLARGEFVCSDASDSRTMSALVVLEPEDVVRPFMRWAVAGSVYPRYERSIKLQEAAYATRAAKNIKMLYWVKDPVKLQDSFYKTARNQTIWATVILWVVLLFGSYLICYKWRWVRPRADKRLEGAKGPSTNTQAQGGQSA